MAGAYPDAPGHRVAYHLDNALARTCSSYTFAGGSTWTDGDQADLETLNNEDDATWAADFTGAYPQIGVALILPEAITCVGAFFASKDNGGTRTEIQQYSPDTTNGVDGTWTTLPSGDQQNATSPFYRANIIPVSSLTVKGMRFGLYCNTNQPAAFVRLTSLHLYESSSVTRLHFWDPSADSRVSATYFDLGDIRRSQVLSKTFRIHNSTALTANSIVVSASMLTDTMTPSVLTGIEFSTDNTNWTATINIGDLAPSANSSVLYARYSASATASLGEWAVAFEATPSGWT